MTTQFAQARVLLAGGGSAGHVNPLLAVASALKERGMIVEALGTNQGLEAELVPAAGLILHAIDKVPAPRRPDQNALLFGPRLYRAVKDVERIIRQGHFDAVVGFGGYVAAPAYLAAKRLGIPVAIHEQNMRPGLANKLGARFADAVALTFDQTPLKAHKGETYTIGLPLREEIQQLAQAREDVAQRIGLRDEAAKSLGLDPHHQILLITGGSLGAQHLNEVMTQAADAFSERHDIIHLTGKGKSDGVKEAVARSGFQGKWLVQEYANNMETMLAASDLVVCRSGAGMVAELTALGLPAVYVPLPIGNGEQRLNAQNHYRVGGAMIFDDDKFDERLVRTYVVPLLDSGDRLARMARKSRQQGRTDAAPRMVEIVESLLYAGQGVRR